MIVDAVLVAAGRCPNVTGLGLEAAGILYDLTDGVKVLSVCLPSCMSVCLSPYLHVCLPVCLYVRPSV